MENPNQIFQKQKSLASARATEFSIIEKFPYGYRHREDQTNLPPGVLVPGSQNVLTNVSERIQCRQGYALDGPTSTLISPIVSGYTFESNLGFERNLRTYLSVPATDTSGTVEYRYVDENGDVTWRTLLTSAGSANFNFTTWWDTAEILREVLMVNRGTDIFEWSGGVTTAASVTSNTITKQGTSSWAEEGFYADNGAHGTRALTIKGVSYTYTGGETTLTLTGVSPDPSGAGIIAGDIAHQTPVTTSIGSMTALTLDELDLIQVFQQQLWLGSLKDQTLFVSNFQDYKDYTISAINESGFGKQFAIDAPPVALIPLENTMTVSAGFSQWYQMSLEQGTYTDNTMPANPVVYNIDNWTVNRLKTNANASAQSQSLTNAMKNDVIFVSQEPTLDTLGRVEQILGTVQTTNISDPIKLDFDDYDFTGGSIFYNKYFVYLSVPSLGIVRIYNIVKGYWEAPQTIPITAFYTVEGNLYGHSSLTAESYQLFTGRADRVTSTFMGNPIPCSVVFSYQNYDSPFTLKNFNKFYVEGYISSNTKLNLGITYEIDGCATDTTYEISGQGSYVCLPSAQGSLGKESLGKIKLGGTGTDTGELPPKFRIIRTFPSTDFHEAQYSFTSSQVNSNWELLRFGPAVGASYNIPTNITI